MANKLIQLKSESGDNYLPLTTGSAVTVLDGNESKPLDEFISDIRGELNAMVRQYQVTLSLSWTANTQTVSMPEGFTAGSAAIVTPAPETYSDYVNCQVRATAQGNGSITFVCSNVPSVEIKANILYFV